jgi:hypothetical protein
VLRLLDPARSAAAGVGWRPQAPKDPEAVEAAVEELESIFPDRLAELRERAEAGPRARSRVPIVRPVFRGAE